MAANSGRLIKHTAAVWALISALTGAMVLTVLAPAPSASAAPRRVTVSAPAQAIEGERFAVTARIVSPKKAKTVQFQILTRDIFQNRTWAKLRTMKVARKKWRSSSVLADDSATMTIRAVVTYKGVKKKVVSRPVTVRVWHWYDLTRFNPYASSGASISNPYISFSMNGATWKGWYSRGGGESRFTLGRNCTRFKAHLGLRDDSADGASGTIALSAIDPSNSLSTLYKSPPLSAGAVVAVDLPLASPYRFAITGQSLTPELETTLAVGGASLLCHIPAA